MATPRSVRWAPSPESSVVSGGELTQSSAAASAVGFSATSSSASSSSLLEFLRVLGISYLYPTLLHLGVRALAGVSALPDGALEAQGVTQISTALLRAKAAEYAPSSAPAGSHWEERVSAEGYASYVNVRGAHERGVEGGKAGMMRCLGFGSATQQHRLGGLVMRHRRRPPPPPLSPPPNF